MRCSLFFASVLLAVVNASAEIPNVDLTASQRGSVKVLTPDQVSYIPLKPARGDSSPRAGVLWGDIRGNTASGVLLKFSDGFSSPPHIHNITYRAVVIAGEIHNDDPDAALLWMERGSFWSQPAGEIHITAVRPGNPATAFLEILRGPYLVQAPSDAFDSGERPLNLLRSNLVWMGVDDFEWIGAASRTEGGPKVALLWGDLDTGAASGSFLQLPANYSGKFFSMNGAFKSVVVEGDVSHKVTSVTNEALIRPGGFFQSAELVSHSIRCQSGNACMLYVRTEGTFSLE